MSGSPFGPWAPNIDRAERCARLRALHALAHVYCRPHVNFLDALVKAETDPEALVAAAEMLDEIPALPRRRMLCAYAAVSRPQR